MKQNSNHQSKIVVTGGSGLIGSCLVKSLEAESYPVFNLDRNTGYDLTRDFPYSEIKDANCIFHLAAIKNSGLSINHAYENLQICLNLAKCKFEDRVIYTSTSHLYSSKSPIPFKETAIEEVRDLYTLSKLTGEKILRNSFSNLIILRISNVYGPQFNKEGILISFFKNLIEGNPLDIYSDGKIKRDRIWIDDVVEALKLAMKSDAKGIFNIGSEKSYSTIEVANMMAEILNKELILNFIPGISNELSDNLLDIEKAKRILGYQPKTTFRKGLEILLTSWLKTI